MNQRLGDGSFVLSCGVSMVISWWSLSGLLVVVVVVVVVVVMVVRVVVILFHCFTDFTVWGSVGNFLVVRVCLIVNMRCSLRMLRSMAKHAARLSSYVRRSVSP